MTRDTPSPVAWRRVQDLPRRTVDPGVAVEWSDALTDRYALTDDVALRPWQGMALAEAVLHDGLFAALPVGQGKTLISWLLPTAMRSDRALIVVPGSLLDKTKGDFSSYVGQWAAPPGAVVLRSREWLSMAGQADWLQQYAPDLIVVDEADDLASHRSACTRRIDRYVRKHDNARVVAMTGTPARKSLLGYWHLLCWCLGGGAPVPMDLTEATIWGRAIDMYRGPRPWPGCLGRTLQDARRNFLDRLQSTPGVLIVDEDSCDTELTVSWTVAPEDPILDDAFETLLTAFESPGGDEVSDPLSMWLLDGQLGLGLYTVWDPPPPEEWRAARRAVARFVRERIGWSSTSHKPLDTEAQVLRRFRDDDIVRRWLEVKPTFAGQTRTVWLTDSTLRACENWLRDIDCPGIVWTGCVDFGRRLAERTGLPYYGQRGQTDAGESLFTAVGKTSIVASWAANKKGFNLQAYRRQLITMPPTSAKWIEQIIGRSHRAGQGKAVHVDVLITSGGTADAFETMLEEAETVHETVGLTQKILRAKINRADLPPGLRWATKGTQ